MNVEQKSAKGLKREYKVTIEASVLDSKMDEKLAQTAAQIRLPGFRPGKVPMAHIRKLHGDALLGEILEETVNSTSREALEEDGVRPALQPEIEITSFEAGSDLEYEMSVEIMPDIEHADFSKISLTREVLAVGNTEIDDAIKNMAEQQKRYEPAPKTYAAADGDAVVIDFLGKVDDEAFEGNAAEDYQLVIGASNFIPGFEEQLVGVKAGDSKDVNVTFPKEYGAENLAGKEAVFEVTVKEVQKPAEIKIDDELAKQLGLSDLAELRKRVGGQIGDEYNQITRQKIKRDLLDTLAEQHQFEVPPGMVTMEFDQMWQEFEQQLETQEKSIEDEDKSEDELRTDYLELANRRVRLGLLLSDIGSKNEIKVTAEELNGAVMAEARRFPGQEQQIFEFYQKNPQGMQQLQAPLYEDKVIDFVLEIAKVTEKKVDLDTLMATDDEVAEERPKSKKKVTAKKVSTKSTPPSKKTGATKKPPAKKKAAATKTNAKKK